MSYPAISLATATVGRHRCPQKRLQTARQPPVYPNSSPDHRACNSLTPFHCPHAVHPCPSVDSGLDTNPTSCWVRSWSGRRRNKKRGLIGRLTPCRLCPGDVSVSVQHRPTPPLVPSPSLAPTRTWRGCGLGLPVHSGWRLWFVGHERRPGEERPLGLSCFVVVTVAAAGQVAVAEDRLDRRPDVPVSGTGQPVGLVSPGICADCVFMPS